jgi:hypothetical protein
MSDSASQYDPRSDIAALLKALFPLWEAGKLGEATAPYDQLVDNFGLARMMVMFEWDQAVADALPKPEPVGDAVDRGKRDVLKRAATYFAERKHDAGLLAIYHSEDTSLITRHRGRHDAFDTAGLYVAGMLEELNG